jgi:hypothetical protein
MRSTHPFLYLCIVMFTLAACDSADTTTDPVAGTPAGMTGGTPAGMTGGTPAGAEGGTPAGTEGGTPAGTEGGTPAGAEGGTPAGAEGGTPAGMVGGTPAGMVGGTPAGMVGGTPAGSEGGTPAGMTGGTPAGAEGGTPAGMVAGTPAGSTGGSMMPLPEGDAFGMSNTIPAGQEDLYYFQTTDLQVVLLETSADGMGTCAPGLDTIIEVYAYANDMRGELIASNDDANGLCSKVLTEFPAGTYQVVVKGYNNGAVDDYILTISYPQAAALGEACSDQIVCTGTAVCDTTTNLCTSASPRVDSATAYYDANQLYLSLNGSDPNQDSGFLDSVALLDQNGLILETYQGDLFGDFIDGFDVTTFTFNTTIDFTGVDFNAVKKARITISDFDLNLSDPYEADVLLLPTIPADGACQTDLYTGKCAEGYVCVATEIGAIAGNCTSNTAPVLDQQAPMFAYSLDGVVLVKLNGSDAEDNIDGMRVRYLDSNNQTVQVQGADTSDLIIFDRIADTYYGAALLDWSLPEYSGIVAVEVSLKDAGNLTSDSTYIAVSTQPLIALGDSCDTNGLENNCGDYACVGGTCQDVIPHVTSGFTTRDGDNLFIKINGYDQDFNIYQIGFHALDAQGQVIAYADITDPLYFEPPVLNYAPNTTTGEFTASIEISNLFIDIPGIDSFLLYAKDSDDFESTPFASSIVIRPNLASGDACDSYRVENLCTSPFACENGTCQMPVPAEVVSARFFYNTNIPTPYLVIKTEVQEGSSALVPKLLFTPKNANGAIVELLPDVDVYLLNTANINETLDNGNQAVYFLLRGNLIDTITQIELWYRDVNDTESNHLTVDIDPIAPLAQGELCTANGNFGACSDGLACINHDGLGSTVNRCDMISQECPASWNVQTVQSVDPITWTFNGDTTGLINGTRGLCGGNGIEQVVSADLGAGTFKATISNSTLDTVLYARTICLDESEMNQLDCNDDTNGTLSEITFNLAQPQTVYLFVDAFRIDVSAAYTLTIVKQ